MSTKAATATTGVEAQESFWSRVPWDKVPLGVTLAGLVGCLIGYNVDAAAQFAHSYLVAFMFFLSIEQEAFLFKLHPTELSVTVNR